MAIDAATLVEPPLALSRVDPHGQNVVLFFLVPIDQQIGDIHSAFGIPGLMPVKVEAIQPEGGLVHEIHS